jgi:hypothetical protein
MMVVVVVVVVVRFVDTTLESPLLTNASLIMIAELDLR